MFSNENMGFGLIFFIIIVNDVFTTLSLITTMIITTSYVFKKNVNQKDKLITRTQVFESPRECFEFWFT